MGFEPTTACLEGRKGHPPPAFVCSRFRLSLYGKCPYGILSVDVYGHRRTAAFGGVRHQIVTTRSPRALAHRGHDKVEDASH